MDPNTNSAAVSAPVAAIDVDDWDTEGFVIPDLSVDESAPLQHDSIVQANKTEEDAASSLYGKQVQLETPIAIIDGSMARNKKLKHKLKEADKHFVATNSHENRVEVLKDLMGGKEANCSSTIPKAASSGSGSGSGSSHDWLDPHCNESEFDRKSL